MKPKILIVEDDSATSLDIKQTLLNFDYSVSSIVHSTENLFKTVKDDMPDLILMDINLNGDMDGIEAAEQLQKIINIPIIYLTAYSDKELVKRAKKTKPYAYIIKPYQDKELYSAIEITLYTHTLEKELKARNKQLEQEITERKEIELALRESKEHYRIIFESAAEGIVVVNAETKKLNYVNSALCNMLGYSKEELTTLTVADIHPIKDLPHVISEFEAQARGEKTLAPNIPCLRKDGKIIYANINASMIKINEKTHLVGFFTDITEHKLIETELKKSEETLKLAFDVTNDGLWDWDLRSGLAYLSPKYYEIIGYTSNEVVSDFEFFKSIIHPDDLPNVLKTMEEHMQGKTAQSVFDYRIITKDGIIKYLMGRGKVVERNSDGTPTRMIGTITNITDRKLMEYELHNKSKLLDDTQKLSKLGGWKYESSTGRVTWTDEVFRIHGVGKDYNPSSADNDISFYSPEHQHIITQAFEKAVNQGEPYDLELQLIRLDGERVWVRTIGQPIIENGKVVSVTGNIIDITERKQAEKALRESEEKFRNLVETSLDLIWKVDNEGRFIYINNAWEHTIGYKVSEIIGRKFKEFQTPEQHEQDIKIISSGTGNKKRLTYETTFINKSKEIIHLVVNAIFIKDEHGNIIGSQGTAHNFTVRKRMEEQLIKYQDKLERVVEERTNELNLTIAFLEKEIIHSKQAELLLRNSEEQIRLLMNCTAEAIYGIDTNGNCIFANPSCVNLLGYKEINDLLGKNMHELIHYKNPDGTSYPINECKIFLSHKENRKIHVDNEVFWKANGLAIPIEYWSYPITKEGKIVGSVVSFIDITERIESEKKLKKLQEILINQEKRALVGSLM
ncbi:MAG: PAS domain S-box protein, partial [Spirochaetota bacterium]|nr:PAS domain S-box protein [Spirochaetota bacterium]